MLRILHLIDETTSDETLALLRRLVRAGRELAWAPVVGRVGRAADESWMQAADGVVHVGERLGGPIATALELRRRLKRTPASEAERHAPDLVHAWSESAAAVAVRVARGHCPTVVTLTGSPRARGRCAWWAARPPYAPPAIACTSRYVRKQAIALGARPDRCTVIYPAAETASPDDGAAHGSANEDGTARRLALRAALGIAPTAPVLMTAAAPSRGGGHYYAVWATAVLQQIWPDIRLIVPGTSAEARRLVRFVESFRLPQLLIRPRTRTDAVTLAAAADLLLVPAIDEAPVGAIAAAMAAGLPIVGTQTPSTAEMLRHGDNAWLCPPRNPMAMATLVRRVLRDPDAMRRVAQTARREAAERFAPARMIDDYRRLYDDVRSGRSMHGRHDADDGNGMIVAAARLAPTSAAG